MNKNLFVQTVTSEFQYLTERYNFSAPVTEDFGREIYVRYDRGDQTVSISYEYGSSPSMEIFEASSRTGEPKVPWASKDGVERSRRFPKFRVASRFSDDELSMMKYIKEMSLQFEQTESNWLKA